MCTRYNLLKNPRIWLKGVSYQYDPVFTPVYNVGPGCRAPVVRELDGGGLGLVPMTWGYMPPGYAGKDTAKWCNARSESVFDSKFWSDAVLHRRCLIPATGYYEFAQRNGQKHPYHVWIKPGGATKGGRPFLMAGVWAPWLSPHGPQERFAVLTMPANDLVSRVHERMPVIISVKDMRRWMHFPDNWMFTGIDGALMDFHEVSRRLNKVGGEGSYVLQMPNVE